MKKKKLRRARAANAVIRSARRIPRSKPGTTGQPVRDDNPERPSEVLPGLRIPPILLEGDEPVAPPRGGPGRKYELGSVIPIADLEAEQAALPEAYGTGNLLLAARDPRWLYAHWDLTPAQQRHYNAQSADRHLVIRVYPGATGTRPATEVHVHPESRHWFIHVGQADTRYVAELGYYGREREWVTVAASLPVATPRETVSEDQTLRFATIPADVRLSELAATLDQPVQAVPAPLEPARALALAELVSRQLAHHDLPSSMEFNEVGGGAAPSVNSAEQRTQAAANLSESVSSPMGSAEPRPAGFWLNVNADVVVYGATEPDATVTLGGCPIQLRPDGTFSCRLALPDGDHTVTVSAMSVEGELRQAELTFSRQTEFRGGGT